MKGQLHTYHMWYRTSFGNGHRQWLARDREHAIAVARIVSGRNPDRDFTLTEDGMFNDPFFVRTSTTGGDNA